MLTQASRSTTNLRVPPGRAEAFILEDGELARKPAIGKPLPSGGHPERDERAQRRDFVPLRREAEKRGLMLVRESSQTDLERGGDIRLGAQVEYDQAEGARSYELVGGASHCPGACLSCRRRQIRDPDNHQGVEIDPSLSRVGRIEEAVITRDPGYRFILLLCLQYQPEDQRERGRRPHARDLYQPPSNLLKAPPCLLCTSLLLQRKDVIAIWFVDIHMTNTMSQKNIY